MIIVIASIHIKEARRSEFIDIFKANIPVVLLQAHLSAPHMLTYREKVKDLVEKVSLKILKEA